MHTITPKTREQYSIMNHLLLQRARHSFVGGVNSPVRSAKAAECDPVLLQSGSGSHVFDYDGNEYIDYVLSYGAALIGHAHPAVVRAMKHAADAGGSLGSTGFDEIELAATLQTAIPLLEKVRFVSSGTEAVMGAVRLARGATGRDIIVKVEHSYHGHADYLLAHGGSGLATYALAGSAGVPRDFLNYTRIVKQGDTAQLKELFRDMGSSIAAVIVEPVGGNFGVIAPDTAFLRAAREVTQEYNALLIFDEVITGFRCLYGSVSERFGVSPDLICLGKIIGGCLPVGAYGGRADIMNHLAPEGAVYQASTFAGNPVVMSAGIATLDVLARHSAAYAQSNVWVKVIHNMLVHTAERLHIELSVSSYDSMFSVRFEEKKHFPQWYNYLLARGINVAPSEYEANFISFAHTRDDIEKTIHVFKQALHFLTKG